VSSALDTNTLDSSFKVECKGKISVDKGDPITCEVPHGLVGLEKILIHSCNVGAVNVGIATGKEILHKYVKNFGLASKTGILLPGEVKGRVRGVKQWGARDQASISFGYAVSATALQMVSGLSAVINDGYIMKPRIIKEITDKNGKIILNTRATQVRRTLKKETSEKMMKMLERVVAEGSGKRAFIEGYKIMGKTGTAQKLNKKGGYSENKYRVSFVGLMKSQEHNLSVYVVVDDPKAKKVFGGTIVAPIVKNIFKHLIRYYDIPPVMQVVKSQKITKISIPDFIGISKKDMLKRKKMFDLNIIVEGAGNNVTFQFPEAGSKVALKNKVYVYCGIEKNSEIVKGSMPYVIGKTLKEAVIILKKAGMTYNIKGSGIVRKQKPLAGSRIEKHTTVEIICGNR